MQFLWLETCANTPLPFTENITAFKGAVIQIEKSTVNNCLCVSKVS